MTMVLSSCARSPHPEIKLGDEIIEMQLSQGVVWWENKNENGKWIREQKQIPDSKILKTQDLKVTGNTARYLEFEFELFGENHIRIPWKFIKEIKTQTAAP